MRIVSLLASVTLLMPTLRAAADDGESEKLTIEQAREAVRDELRAGIENWRKSFLESIEMHVEEISLDCELDKDQATRLKLAGRGAVEHHVKRWMETIARRVADGEEPDSGEVVESLFDEDDDTHQQLRVMIGHYGFLRILTRERVWQRSLKTTLTADQLKQIQARMAKREASWQRMAMRWAMELLDRDLLLAERQVEKLRPILAEHLKDYDPMLANVYGLYILNVWLYQIDPKQLKPVFTERQFQIWKTRHELYAEEFGGESIAEYSFQGWFESDYALATGKVEPKAKGDPR